MADTFLTELTWHLLVSFETLRGCFIDLSTSSQSNDKVHKQKIVHIKVTQSGKHQTGIAQVRDSKLLGAEIYLLILFSFRTGNLRWYLLTVSRTVTVTVTYGLNALRYFRPDATVTADRQQVPSLINANNANVVWIANVTASLREHLYLRLHGRIRLRFRLLWWFLCLHLYVSCIYFQQISSSTRNPKSTWPKVVAEHIA